MSNLSIENLAPVLDRYNLESRLQKKASTSGESQSMTSQMGDVTAGQESFGELLTNAVQQVNQHQVQADQAIKEVIAGKSKNIHEAMLAIERAEMSLKLMMQVRNKILDAYREIMKMQI